MCILLDPVDIARELGKLFPRLRFIGLSDAPKSRSFPRPNSGLLAVLDFLCPQVGIEALIGLASLILKSSQITGVNRSMGWWTLQLRDRVQNQIIEGTLTLTLVKERSGPLRGLASRRKCSNNGRSGM